MTIPQLIFAAFLVFCAFVIVITVVGQVLG
jgi:hypothetical protein